MRTTLLLLIAACLALSQGQNILTTVSFPDLTTSIAIPSNIVGLSFTFEQIYQTAMSSATLKGLIKNSWVYGSTSASWGMSIKMQNPPGYKYDCFAWESFYVNASCLVDVQSYYPQIATFLTDTANSHLGLSIGFDR